MIKEEFIPIQLLFLNLCSNEIIKSIHETVIQKINLFHVFKRNGFPLFLNKFEYFEYYSKLKSDILRLYQGINDHNFLH